MTPFVLIQNKVSSWENSFHENLVTFAAFTNPTTACVRAAVICELIVPVWQVGPKQGFLNIFNHLCGCYG